MYYVYILFSLKDKKLYTGFTKNLKIRITQHKNGFVKSTKKRRRPLILVYYEVYLCKKNAKQREKYLKGGNGRASLKIQLKDILTKLNYKCL